MVVQQRPWTGLELLHGRKLGDLGTWDLREWEGVRVRVIPDALVAACASMSRAENWSLGAWTVVAGWDCWTDLALYLGSLCMMLWCALGCDGMFAGPDQTSVLATTGWTDWGQEWLGEQISHGGL